MQYFYQEIAKINYRTILIKVFIRKYVWNQYEINHLQPKSLKFYLFFCQSKQIILKHFLIVAHSFEINEFWLFWFDRSDGIRFYQMV